MGSGTRDAILVRAMEIASLEGLEGLTIGRLASDLELSKSGLFGHFGSKEELQLATLERAVAVFRREVVDAAAGSAPGLERLRALIESYLHYMEREVFPGGCFLVAAAAEFDGRPGPVRDAIAAASDDWGSELRAEAETARERGDLPADADPPQVAFELNAFAEAANGAYQLRGDATAFERARRGIARSLSGR